MEINSHQKSINCCFCDLDLSLSSQSSNGKRIVRYKCPACERYYCSSDCSSGHKDKFECSGIRNKTPYVHLSKFDEKQFLDDYFFLEDINIKIETAHRILPKLKINKINVTNNNNNKKRHNRKKNWKKSKQVKVENSQKY